MAEPDVGPGYLFVGGHADPDSTEWGDLGETTGGFSLTVAWDERGIVTEMVAHGEPNLDPASRAVARTPEPIPWSIGDALAFLWPQPPRRTLSRWLSRMTPVGYRTAAQGGPPVAEYAAAEIMLRHAEWAKRR